MTFEERVKSEGLFLEKALLPDVDDIRFLYIMRYLTNASNLDLDEDTIADSFFGPDEVDKKEEARTIISDFKNDMSICNQMFDDDYNIKVKYLVMAANRQDILVDDADEFINDIFPDEDFIFYREALDTLFIYNTNLLHKLRKEIDELESTVRNSKNAVLDTKVLIEEKSDEVVYEAKSNEDFDDLINLLLSLDNDEEKNRFLSTYSNSIIGIKFRLCELINEVRYNLGQYDPLVISIDKLVEMRNLFDKYNSLLEFVKSFAIIDSVKIEEKELNDNGPLNKVVFVPNNHNSTYLCDDITYEIDRKQEIKLELDKLFSGYFLRSKRVKQLQGYEDLWEYKGKNIRIMFVQKNGIFYVTSLFFKKAQKCPNEYEEAIRRYKAQEEVLNNNLGDVNFMFEQQEYISELEEILNQKTYVRGEI